jgi:hypothetical protein
MNVAILEDLSDFLTNNFCDTRNYTSTPRPAHLGPLDVRTLRVRLLGDLYVV